MKRGDLVFTKTFKAEFISEKTRGSATMKVPTGSLMVLIHMGSCLVEDMGKVQADALLESMGWVSPDDAEESATSRRDLVRRLDVLLNGEAEAAKQASLCDIVAQVEKEGIKALPADLKERRNAMMLAAEKASYAYFVECDVGPERTAASEIYENLRTAGRVY